MQNFKLKTIILNYFIDSLMVGIYGFLLFLFIDLIIKIFNHVFVTTYTVNFAIEDMLIASLGFCLAVMISIINNSTKVVEVNY